MEIVAVVSSIVAVAEFVAICFLVPMAQRVNEVAKQITEIDKKLLTPEEIDKTIDLKIYSHMSKCHAHNTWHKMPESKTEP